MNWLWLTVGGVIIFVLSKKKKVQAATISVSEFILGCKDSGGTLFDNNRQCRLGPKSSHLPPFYPEGTIAKRNNDGTVSILKNGWVTETEL